MIRKTFIALAATALAGGPLVSPASAKQNGRHHAQPAGGAPAAAQAPQAGEIQGVNPMNNPKQQAPVQNAQPYQKMPSVNPM